MNRTGRNPILMALGLVLLVGISGCNQAERVAPVAQASASGSGEVSAAPDMAVISGAVIANADQPDAALGAVRQQLDSLINAVLAQQVEKKDLQAAQVTVTPQWHYPRDGKRELTGYEARAGFSLTLRDLEQLPAVYSVLAQAGVAQLQAPQFDFSNRDELELQAIGRAVEHARRKVVAGLDPLQAGLGDVQQLNVDTQWQRPMMKTAVSAVLMEAAADREPRLNVGEQTITATVQVVFAIKH
ncbi:SIMPL domain-containing protein [Pseudomaricurvus sp. HS19]|uniref:SIMPL domain-containing protein n=1 Tax=Pseudomaricurvus sp. HS19 TaxID=2692626 RepID=UPI001368518F|nr:SIMPL domain-containing protein [Pseudomaricurvus sp. HS19]MYM62609.1 DUF541 domain-containing protein [Pseudomaricurvus sp. HS19]